VDRPFNPVALALGADASFVARSVDVNAPHLKEVLRSAATHRGAAFIEILQNCNIFNDGAWKEFRDKEVRDDHLLVLRQGEPLVFGKGRDRGIRLAGCHRPEVVPLGNGVDEKDLLAHDERAPLGYAFMLAHMQPPEFPLPIGVFRRSEEPTLEESIHEQIAAITAKKGPGELGKLLRSGDVWEVK